MKKLMIAIAAVVAIGLFTGVAHAGKGGYSSNNGYGNGGYDGYKGGTVGDGYSQGNSGDGVSTSGQQGSLKGSDVYR